MSENQEIQDNINTHIDQELEKEKKMLEKTRSSSKFKKNFTRLMICNYIVLGLVSSVGVRYIQKNMDAIKAEQNEIALLKEELIGIKEDVEDVKTDVIQEIDGLKKGVEYVTGAKVDVIESGDVVVEKSETKTEIKEILDNTIILIDSKLLKVSNTKIIDNEIKYTLTIDKNELEQSINMNDFVSSESLEETLAKMLLITSCRDIVNIEYKDKYGKDLDTSKNELFINIYNTEEDPQLKVDYELKATGQKLTYKINLKGNGQKLEINLTKIAGEI